MGKSVAIFLTAFTSSSHLITAFGQMQQAFGDLGFLLPPPGKHGDPDPVETPLPSPMEPASSSLSSSPSSPLQPRPSPCLLRKATIANGNNAQLRQTKLSFQHWSRPSPSHRNEDPFGSPLLQETPLPGCKVRRTMSECLPLPLSPVRTRSDSGVSLGEIIRLPCHASPKDAIKRLTPDTVIQIRC